MSARHVADHTWIGGPLRSFICGLGGHELLRSFEPGRICLRCTSCPYETRGWILKEEEEEETPSPAPMQGRPALVAQNAR